MTDECKDEPTCKDESKIEPYYQMQAKHLADFFFDQGLLSESLSRDGINGIEGFLALYFQQIADNSARAASFTKKYKNLGGKFFERDDDEDNRERHAEEMRWIARARCAEEGLEAALLKLERLDGWHKDVVKLLKGLVEPPYADDILDPTRASNLLARASKMIDIAEPEPSQQHQKPSMTIEGAGPFLETE